MQLNLFKIQDFNLTCRTCLQRKDTALIPIFSTEIANMLLHCQFWDVSEQDGCPDKICTDCEQSLKLSYKFKLRCSESQTILAKVLSECNDENFVDSGDSKDGTDNVSHKQIDLEGLKDGDDLISFLEAPLPPPLAYTCEKCSQSFREENDLNVHQSVHGEDLICLSCAKKCSNRQMLKRHIKIHMIDKPHVCQDCGKGFSESHALSKHKLHHSGLPRKKNHMCHQCGQGFSEPFYLTVHLRKHTGERPLVCSECGKSFADPRSFKIHQMTHTGEKPYKCHICPKAFSQSVNLTKHIRVHTGERPYVCKNCGKGFTQSSSLEKHYRTHTGEKPFECSKCTRRFSEKGSLVNHMRLHTGEKPYVCGECGRSFSNSSEFGLHTRKHQGIKRNVCHFCGKDFASVANLSAHLRIHTGERPFKCATCGRQFVEKGALRRHAKVHMKPDNNSRSLITNEFDTSNGIFSLEDSDRVVGEALASGTLYADSCL